MSALEEIQRAIEKLTELKAASTPGEWDIIDDGDRFIAWHADPSSTGFDYILDEPVEFERGADALLIVTLHRTIDAQLAILTRAYNMQTMGREQIVHTDLALARAITGTP